MIRRSGGGWDASLRMETLVSILASSGSGFYAPGMDLCQATTRSGPHLFVCSLPIGHEGDHEAWDMLLDAPHNWPLEDWK